MTSDKNPNTPSKYNPLAVGDIELALPKGNSSNGAAGGEKTGLSVPDEEKSNVDMTEHLLDMKDLEMTMLTNFELGLSSAEAAIRLERDGPNRLTPPKQLHWFWKALAHIAGGFALLLWAGSILCFIVYGLDGSIENLTLAIVLAGVVLATGIFSWYQEAKSDAVLAGFMKLAPPSCDAIRDGKFVNIPSDDLVVGDIVRLQFGKKIPADVVILESQGIKVDNSSLTGESEPLKRTPGATDPSPWRSKNVAFFGTNCVEGTGKAIVVKIGDATAIGNIASATLESEKPQPLMTTEISRFVNIIGSIAILIGIVFLICALVMGYTTQEAIIFTIGIIVANVPEGLLATVTVALTITAKRMADKNVLVKSNLIVETLGSITAIASDKTGTLTQNRMTVRNLIFSDSSTFVAKHPKISTSVNLHDDKEAATPTRYLANYLDLVKVAGLCNHATFDERESDILQRRTNGDASENALMKFSHSNGNVDILRAEFPEIACIPFNSANKFMVTIHKNSAQPGSYLLFMKGAPERVLEKCTTYLLDGTSRPFQDINAKVVEANTKLASNGERVLAFARFTLHDLPDNFVFDTEDISKLNFDISNMEFLGMISLEDPPRTEVPGAIQSCHSAGIKVIMVTGDHPLTARSIAAQIGILKPEDKNAAIFDPSQPPDVRCNPSQTGIVVTGNTLAQLTDQDWDFILSRQGIVFARTLPTQKQDIVARLQSCDEVVAVTGDGVNDSPALKKADVGIAMGSGSEIAKEASDLILVDDNFASIVKGIEEGRLIFANLKKSIAYTLTSNIPEIVPFLCQIALKFPLGLTTIMILCIDLGTDILPAISFSYEVPEANIMKVPPRNRHTDKLVTWQLISFSYLQIGVIQAFCAYTVFFYQLSLDGYSTSYLVNGQLGFHWNEEDYTGCIENSKVEGGCADFETRRYHLRTAQSSFLAAIVVCQMGCGLVCKTRMNSLFSQGMKNHVFNYALLQETVLIILLVYAPGIQDGFGTKPVDGLPWAVMIPFFFFIIFYDEVRKYLCRTYPDSLFKKLFYF